MGTTANWFFSIAIFWFLMSPISTAQAPKPTSQKSRLQYAAQAISAGKLEQAESELQSVLRLTPDEFHALDLLGVIRVLQHKEPQAEDLFSRAVQKNPNFAPGRAHLGLLYLQTGHAQQAIPQLREAIRIDPARTDAVDALVRILQDQSQSAVDTGELGSALAMLNEARGYAPANADLQSAFGTLALRMSLQQDAVEALQKALQLRPNDPVALYNLGRAFMGLSKFEDARQQFAEYIEIRPGDPSGHCALGMTLAALEHSPEAKAEFERSIELAPAQTESYYRLGLLELQSREFDAASKNLRQALDREPANAPVLTALGKGAFEQQLYSDAIPLLKQAIISDGTMREAHYYLGLAFARTGQKQQSEEQLAIATRLEHEEVEHRRRVSKIADPCPPKARGGSNPKY